MSTEKNIILQQFNGADYDTLYPKTKSIQTYVSDEVISKLVLSSGANADDALQAIANKLKLVADGVASITVTVTDDSGNAVKNIIVDGIFSDSGTEVYTNDSGVATGYISEGEQTISINYGDLSNISEAVSIVKGETINKSYTVSRRNFLKITSSQQLRFSSNVSQIDVTVVGGGGGGSGAYNDEKPSGGGGGGYCTVQEQVNFTINKAYPAVIGSGGAGGGANSRGSTGGSTSFLRVTASGGEGGYIGFKGVTCAQANGNGPGGSVDHNYAGVAGSVAGYTSFTETTIYGGGGGSGAYASGSSLNNGANYGGKGAVYDTDVSKQTAAVAGQDGFGGGGGGGETERNYLGAKGGSGCVAIRMHLTVT